MFELLDIVLPVFGLVAIGYGGARLGLVNDRMENGLNDFLFTFCMPVMLFRLVNDGTVPDSIPLSYWLSYYIAMAVVWIAASLSASRLFGRDHGESVIAGLAAGQANLTMVGVPIILKAYGAEAGFAIAMLLAVNLPISTTVATLMLERGKQGGFSWRTMLRSLVTHPILIGIFVGLIAKLFGLHVSGAAKQITDQIGGMAVPGALISLGMTMKRYGLREGLGLSSLVTALRLLAHPALTFVLAFYVFRLPPVWAGSAVLFAASSAGVNVYLFAARYKEGEALASSVVALTTGFAAITTVFWLWMLGVG
jgi:malonate transporter